MSPSVTAHSGGTSILHVSKARCSFKYRAKNRSAWACSFLFLWSADSNPCIWEIVLCPMARFAFLIIEIRFLLSLDGNLGLEFQRRSTKLWSLMLNLGKNFIVLTSLLTLLWLIDFFSSLSLFCNTLVVLQLSISSCFFTELVLVCSISCIFIMKYNIITKWGSTVLRNVKRIKRIAYWSGSHLSSKNNVYHVNLLVSLA